MGSVSPHQCVGKFGRNTTQLQSIDWRTLDGAFLVRRFWQKKIQLLWGIPPTVTSDSLLTGIVTKRNINLKKKKEINTTKLIKGLVKVVEKVLESKSIEAEKLYSLHSFIIQKIILDKRTCVRSNQRFFYVPQSHLTKPVVRLSNTFE